MNSFKVFLLVSLAVVGLSLSSLAQNSSLTINNAGTVINPIPVINFPSSIEVGGIPVVTNGQSTISFDNGAITSDGSGSLHMDNLIITYPGYIYGSLTSTYPSIDPSFKILFDYLGNPTVSWGASVLNGNWSVGNFSSTLYTGNANGETNFPPFNLTITVTNNFTLSLSGSTNVTLVCSSNAPLTITLPSLQGYVATILQAGTNTIYVSNSVVNGGFSIPAPWVLGGGMTNVFTNRMTLAGYFGHSITLGYLNPTNDIPINIGFTKPEISDIVTNLAVLSSFIPSANQTNVLNFATTNVPIANLNFYSSVIYQAVNAPSIYYGQALANGYTGKPANLCMYPLNNKSVTGATIAWSSSFLATTNVSVLITLNSGQYVQNCTLVGPITISGTTFSSYYVSNFTWAPVGPITNLFIGMTNTGTGNLPGQQGTITVYGN